MSKIVTKCNFFKLKFQNLVTQFTVLKRQNKEKKRPGIVHFVFLRGWPNHYPPLFGTEVELGRADLKLFKFVFLTHIFFLEGGFGLNEWIEKSSEEIIVGPQRSKSDQHWQVMFRYLAKAFVRPLKTTLALGRCCVSWNCENHGVGILLHSEDKKF